MASSINLDLIFEYDSFNVSDPYPIFSDISPTNKDVFFKYICAIMNVYGLFQSTRKDVTYEKDHQAFRISRHRTHRYSLYGVVRRG